jgi:hypothetical protein
MALARQSIITAIITQLKTITPANGYYLNFADSGTVEKVFDNRITELEEDELPIISISDKDETPNNDLMSGSRNPWWRDLDIDISIVTNGEVAVADIRKAIADVQSAVGVDTTWGGLALDTRWIGTVIGRDQMEEKILDATVQIRVIYQTVEWEESI